MAQFEVTPEQAEGLRIARALVEHGVPVFAAAPCPDGCKTPGHEKLEFHLPRAWQKITPSIKQLERWRPGWGLAAIGGHAVDFLDEDPRSGGDKSVAQLRAAGAFPNTYGIASTKSDGFHYVIAPLRESRMEGPDWDMPGLDYQGGRADGEGRAFVWIAPTVAKSKTTGELSGYRWDIEPYWEEIEDLSGDDSGDVIRERIRAKRAPEKKEKEPEIRESPEKKDASGASSPVSPSLMDDPFMRTSQIERSAQQHGGGVREFTPGEAEAYISGARTRLREAQIGSIEARANDLAIMLSHFVPDFWSADDAFAMLESDLAETAYDPNHPAAAWTAEKFKPVIAMQGNRVRDPWKAARRQVVLTREAPPEPATADEVDALLAEMLTFDQIVEKTPPESLIKGLLMLDSEAWIIGAPGSKKSFVVLDMAAHVALGLPWRGRRVKRGLVVIIAAEGAGGLTHRAKAWMLRNGKNPMTDVRVLPRPVQAADKHAWSVLVEACRRLSPVLVIVDTQARSTVGLEENSATDMGHYVEAVSAVRQATGACVLSVHHTGRNGGDARGSSAIDGAQYTELKVECESGKFSGRLVTEKQKDIEQAEPIALKFERVVVGVDEEGEDITSLVLVERDAYEDASGQEEGPEPWESQHGEAQVRLIKVLRDQGGSVGLTKAEARTSVVERFYGGDTKKLARSTWATAWTKVLEKNTAAGDPIAVNVSGQKWIIDPLALETLSREAAEAEKKPKD